MSWAGGPTAYAMCAIDTLGMSAMLGRPVTITAAEPDTGIDVGAGTGPSTGIPAVSSLGAQIAQLCADGE